MTSSASNIECLKQINTNREKGVALLIALFTLVVMSLIGLSIMVNSSSEVLVNDNFKKSRVTFFGAEAAVEEARFRLGDGAGTNKLASIPSTPTTAVYILGRSGIDPTTGNASSNPFFDPEYSGAITYRNSSGTTVNVGSSTLTSRTLVNTVQGANDRVPFAWSKVTVKTERLSAHDVNQDGTYNAIDPVYYGRNKATGKVSQYIADAAGVLAHEGQPVYLVTALGADQVGAVRKLQTEVAIPPPVNVNAAIDSFQDVDFSGNLDISGVDECNPANMVYGVSSAGTIDSLNPSQSVIGRTPPPPALPTDPSLCPGCPFTHDVPGLIQMLKDTGLFQDVNSSGTNVSCSGTPVACSGSNVNLGTPPNVPPPGIPTNTPVPKYYYSPGDLTLTSNNSVGYGILIVDGNVNMHGGVYFEGIIIARGTFNFTGGGGNNINIRGAVISGESINDTTSDLGGSIEIQYNSCSLINAWKYLPMTILSFKDRMIY
ncbi:MAG: pilus assembly PilX N-terminal domain-containing protein [Acidobacteriota bacterium]